MKVPYTNFAKQIEDDGVEVLAAMRAVMARGDFILGKEVNDFEERFATYCGTKHAVGVANGTDSLFLSMLALGIKPGDEVITCPNSWISTAASIALIGARPVFVDVCEDQNMDPDKLQQAITAKTKAIIPVHLGGRPAKMEDINVIAGFRNIPVIEDAAQSVGSSLNGKRTGSMGVCASFSLHPLKNLNALGDAGIITTNSDALATRLRKLRNHGLRNRDECDFWGYNSRLDTLQAAVLIPRLLQLGRTIQRRKAVASHYSEALQKCVVVPSEGQNEFHSYHTYVVKAPDRDRLREYLDRQGIETKIHYPIPIHLQRAASHLGYSRGSFPQVEADALRILSLPINQYLTDDQVEHVIESIYNFYT